MKRARTDSEEAEVKAAMGVDEPESEDDALEALKSSASALQVCTKLVTCSGGRELSVCLRSCNRDNSRMS